MVSARDKLESMKRGEEVITNDAELDAMLELGDDSIDDVRSVPNPKRVGVLDQYVAWIEHERNAREGRVL